MVIHVNQTENYRNQLGITLKHLAGYKKNAWQVWPWHQLQCTCRVKFTSSLWIANTCNQLSSWFSSLRSVIKAWKVGSGLFFTCWYFDILLLLKGLVGNSFSPIWHPKKILQFDMLIIVTASFLWEVIEVRLHFGRHNYMVWSHEYAVHTFVLNMHKYFTFNLYFATLFTGSAFTTIFPLNMPQNHSICSRKVLWGLLQSSTSYPVISSIILTYFLDR